MVCLHCGDCCKRMSPFGGRCPHIIEKDSFVFCGIYEDRPDECVNHKFDSNICPVGQSVLNLSDDQIYDRAKDGYWMSQSFF